MKKTIIITALAALATVSSYGQGYINYQGFLHNVGNNYTTPGTVTYSTGMYVELFYAAAGTSTAVSALSSYSSTTAYTTAAAWALITGDSNFQAVDGTGGAGTVAVIATAANGGGTYNSSAAYSVANLTGTTTYTFYEVAWYAGASGQYTTLAEAAAANVYVGWSKAFSYTPTATGNPAPANFTSTLVGNYDLGGTVIVPEPCTMALLGLGGLSLLVIRRRK
jgi:hypothetical protein